MNPKLGASPGILLTMVRRAHAALAAEVEAEVRQALRRHSSSPTAVPRSVRLAEAPSHGLPCDRVRPPLPGAEAYWKVAMELVDRAYDRGLGPGPRSPDRRRRAARPAAGAPAGRRDSREPAPAAPAASSPRRPTGSRARSSSEGLLQPIVVRPRQAGGYELIAGERRWRAAREAGLATLPALIREADDRDSLLLALVENVAREQLSPVEEARAYASLVDEFELTLGDVAERVGRSKPAVSTGCGCSSCPRRCSGWSPAAS